MSLSVHSYIWKMTHPNFKKNFCTWPWLGPLMMRQHVLWMTSCLPTMCHACLLVSFLITEGRRSFRAPAVSIVACPSPTLNTLPLICLTSPWYHLSIFASACLVFSSHQFYLPVFQCTVTTWPKHWSLRLCAVASSRSCGCISCSTDVLVPCVVQLTLNNRRYAVISKPRIHLTSTAFSLQVSHPYSATVHTKVDKSLCLTANRRILKMTHEMPAWWQLGGEVWCLWLPWLTLAMFELDCSCIAIWQLQTVVLQKKTVLSTKKTSIY